MAGAKTAANDRDVGTSDSIQLRHPRPSDGPRIYDLIAECAPLEQNSLYANVLQCTHFSDTCLIAESAGTAVGWVSGYRLPDDPETLFVWQVAVASQMRGRGLGKKLLSALTAQAVLAGVSRIETTITSSNDPSWALFEAFADDHSAALKRTPHFGRNTHFGGRHETEHLVTVAPLMPGIPSH